MANFTNDAVSFAHKNKDRYLNELIELIKIPSVSTDSAFKDDIAKAAEWLANKLESIGIENVKIMETGGHPIVSGENLKAGKDAPTVLVYGHYDVQPADPLELWDSPPFEPEVRDNNLFGRGTSDMKGQILASINAIEAVRKFTQLPVNIKFLLEGEEEMGSPSLAPFIKKHKDLFASDFCLNPDSGMLGADLPTITYGLRGLAYFEINVQGPASDLHSGLFGGVVKNPANELMRLLAGMHDEDGHITLPGFYDKVRKMDAGERAEMAALPMDGNYFLKNTGAPALFGEKGFIPAEQVGARPTMDVNGFLTGYTGEGSKTVLPAKAMAKFSFRLVPDQDPEDVHQQVLQYLKANANPGITWELTAMASGGASMTPTDSVGVQALADALRVVWGTKPLYYRGGGSIPVVAEMKDILGINSVLTGFGLPDDNLHAPNEKLSLEPWYKGIDALIHFFINLGKVAA